MQIREETEVALVAWLHSLEPNNFMLHKYCHMPGKRGPQQKPSPKPADVRPRKNFSPWVDLSTKGEPPTC